MTTVLTRLELGDTDGHPFHGNQYTGGMGGDGDGKAGASIKGDVGNRLLRAAMIEGLGAGIYLHIDPKSWESLSDANEAMRGAAKAEVVEAAGTDIAKAAVEDPAVQAEINERYGFGEGHDLDARSALEQEYLDTYVYNPDQPEPFVMTNEELYGKYMAQQYVDAWATSAADSDPTSLGLQQVTAEILGAKSDSFDTYLGDEKTAYEHESATMKAFVQGEYDRTQTFLKDNGITEVTLHRGFSSDVSYPEPGPQRVDMNPASSWSVDRETAEQFSDNGFSETSGANAYVLTMTVPASDVISTARTGQGALHEGEVIVRNQPGSVAYVGPISYNAPDFEGSPVPDDELVTY